MIVLVSVSSLIVWLDKSTSQLSEALETLVSGAQNLANLTGSRGDYLVLFLSTCLH